jgi:hypothetical protein
MRRVGVALLVFGLSVKSAYAQSATSSAAIALFDEGVRLMEQGQYAEACPKLARSQDLSPNGGTLLALAECHSKAGHVASSWVAYRELAARARAAGKADAERRANDAARDLEARLSWLTVNVAEEVEGLEVKRDGQVLPKAEWRIAVPIDPGKHTVEAKAPGRVRFATEVVVEGERQKPVVEIPRLDEDRAAAPAAPVRETPHDDTASPPSEGSGQRVLGIAIGALGLAGIGVGSYFGLQAASKNDDASQFCRDETRCTSQGMQLDDEARSAATVSTIGFIAGGIALATGIVIYLTAPRHRDVARMTPLFTF